MLANRKRIWMFREPLHGSRHQLCAPRGAPHKVLKLSAISRSPRGVSGRTRDLKKAAMETALFLFTCSKKHFVQNRSDSDEEHVRAERRPARPDCFVATRDRRCHRRAALRLRSEGREIRDRAMRENEEKASRLSPSTSHVARTLHCVVVRPSEKTWKTLHPPRLPG